MRRVEKDMVKINEKIRKAVNNRLYTLSKVRHPSIPLDDMFKALEDNGLTPIQEDGTKWSGFLCGLAGEAILNVINEEGKLIKHFLCFQWYKDASQKTYELNAYLS
jgi:hypothetical protein